MNAVFKNVKIYGRTTDITVERGVITSLDKTQNNGTDCSGLSAYPGLIDIHIHGCGGWDVMDGDKLAQMSELLASKGITAWLPTTMTAPHEKLVEITNQNTQTENGAMICGFHLEGPYLSREYAGAQAPEYMCPPDIKKYREYKNVKLITIAPELEGSNDFIKKCGAVVSLGHTGCSYSQACDSFDSGAVCITHAFNAMAPFRHREPALIGAGMDKRAYVQVICDGEHLHPAAVRMLYRTFGAERMILISDGMRAVGMPDGEYELGGRQVFVKNKKAVDKNGTIAGSAVFLSDCVKKAVEFGIGKKDAIKMAAENPAKMMGLKKGKIDLGYDCDLVLCDDEGRLIYTVSQGKIVYKR